MESLKEFLNELRAIEYKIDRTSGEAICGLNLMLQDYNNYPDKYDHSKEAKIIQSFSHYGKFKEREGHGFFLRKRWNDILAESISLSNNELMRLKERFLFINNEFSEFQLKIGDFWQKFIKENTGTFSNGAYYAANLELNKSYWREINNLIEEKFILKYEYCPPDYDNNIYVISNGRVVYHRMEQYLDSPHRICMALGWIIKRREEVIAKAIKDIDKMLAQPSTTTTTPTGFKLGKDETYLKALYKALVDAQFLAKSTKESHFVNAFNGQPLEDFEPLEWTDKAQRNHTVTIQTVFQLLVSHDIKLAGAYNVIDKNIKAKIKAVFKNDFGNINKKYETFKPLKTDRYTLIDSIVKNFKL
jgi:hypothetical protein